MKIMEDGEHAEQRKTISKLPLNEQIDSIKNTLYRKIDICFLKYGLRGLKKIDESIAEGLKAFIAEEEGETVNSTSTKEKSISLGNRGYDDAIALAGEMEEEFVPNPEAMRITDSVKETSQETASEYTSQTEAPSSYEMDDALSIASGME